MYAKESQEYQNYMLGDVFNTEESVVSSLDTMNREGVEGSGEKDAKSLGVPMQSVICCGFSRNVDSSNKSLTDCKIKTPIKSPTENTIRSSSSSDVSDANVENESSTSNVDADYEEIVKGSVCSASSTNVTEFSVSKFSNQLPSDLPLVTPQEYSLQKILREERTVPCSHVYLISLLFLVVLLINILKGGGAFPSPLGIACGSAA